MNSPEFQRFALGNFETHVLPISCGTMKPNSSTSTPSGLNPKPYSRTLNPVVVPGSRSGNKRFGHQQQN